MALNFKVVIPARMKSTRLPGKPLIDIAGKSLLQRTFLQCAKAVSVDQICVLTDDNQIVDHCRKHGMPVAMTSEKCATGTDRVAEYAAKNTFDFYINVQGDEPLINPNDILKVIDACKESPTAIVNGYCAIDEKDEFYSVSTPKVVFSSTKKLLYMSRTGIPGNKNKKFTYGYRQVCVYGFPAKALHEFAQAERKTPLENEEDIEIIRFLEMDFQVQMIELSKDSVAVDNPEDVEKVLKRL